MTYSVDTTAGISPKNTVVGNKRAWHVKITSAATTVALTTPFKHVDFVRVQGGDTADTDLYISITSGTGLIGLVGVESGKTYHIYVEGH